MSKVTLTFLFVYTENEISINLKKEQSACEEIIYKSGFLLIVYFIRGIQCNTHFFPRISVFFFFSFSIFTHPSLEWSLGWGVRPMPWYVEHQRKSGLVRNKQ